MIEKIKTFTLEIFLVILSVTLYFFGYYFLTYYTFLFLIVRLVRIFSKSFDNKIIEFRTDQQTIKNHYLKDFKVFYYLAQSVRVLTGAFYIFFFFFLNPESLEHYSFMFWIITSSFILINFIDLGLTFYIIFYKKG